MSNGKSSWEPVEEWYDRSVGEKGSFYHEHLILPGIARLFRAAETPRAHLLELGCGQGVVARALPPHWSYTGVDLSPSLIASAQKLTKRKNTQFLVGDATVSHSWGTFSHALFLLSLQNMESLALALQNASSNLAPGGQLLLILNHPCYRIPRQSSWEVDEPHKLLYRRVNRYLSPLKIPIAAHPSKGAASAATYSFHFSLHDLFQALSAARFATLTLEEWTSPKKSEGKHARMEDRARTEFPLFLALLAQKALNS